MASDDLDRYRRHARVRFLSLATAGTAVASLSLAGTLLLFGARDLPVLAALGLVPPLLVLLAARVTRRRSEEKDTGEWERVFGVPREIAALRRCPELLERVKGRIVKVHVMRNIEASMRRMSGGTTRAFYTLFVTTPEGESYEVATERDAETIEEDARWLAERLGVPVIDASYGRPVEF